MRGERFFATSGLLMRASMPADALQRASAARGQHPIQRQPGAEASLLQAPGDLDLARRGRW